MNFSKRAFAATAAAAGVALLVAACGGGDGAIAPKTSVNRIVVLGDSLADVGTFGYKFTVQNPTDARGFPIFTQFVASSFGLDGMAQCNFFRFTGTTFVPNSAAGCTNYAVGGGRIVNPASNGGAAAPFSIPMQMATAASVVGTYKDTDVVLLLGGGNDAADLVGAFLGAGSGAAGAAAFQGLLLQQIDAATLTATLTSGGANGPGLAAGLYMQRLADTFYNQIKANLLDKGATKVAVLNAPDITLTPRFQAVLGGVTAQAGAAQSAAIQAGIRQWIGAFNAQLKTRIANDGRIAQVDFFTDFTDQVNNPASYSLVNATRAVCPVVGVDGQGLPNYDFPKCTSAALDAAPPAGTTGAGWWSNYAFSDGFHPTPYGHKLLSASVSRALARAGWL